MIKRSLIALLAMLTLLPKAGAQQFMEQDHMHIGVLLPLKEQSSRGPKMIEFYQGMLLAADSLRRDGLFVDITVHDCGRTQEAMDSLLASTSLAGCDVIFGPLDGIQVTALADYCNLHGIRLVQPFATTTAQVPGHERQFVVTAPRDTVQAAAVDFVRKELFGRNYILVDTHEQNEEGVAMTNAMRYTLSRDGVFLRLLDIDGNDMDFTQAFNPLRPNLVVLNSPSLKALNKFLPKLKAYQQANPDCKISLLGFPSWQTYTTLLQQEFHQFDTFIYTPFYREPESSDVKAYESSFARWFGHPMAATYPRYGIMGFDLAMFFMRGISLYGNMFEHNLNQGFVRPLQNPLVFVRAGRGNGFVNHAVRFVHFTRDHDIEVLIHTE